MRSDVCALAATGGGEGTIVFLVLAALLLAGGAVLMLAARKRRRAGAGIAAIAILALAAGAMLPAAPASAAECPPSPSPSPSASPSTSPVVIERPDIVPALTVPTAPIDGAAQLVVTVSNIGPGASNGPVELTVELPVDSGFSLSFDPAATTVDVDGVSYPVQNGSFTVTGTGVAGDPFRVSTTVVIASGATISFSLGVTVQQGATEPAVLLADVLPGTGGGETPTTNNQATATLQPFVEEGCVAINDKSPTNDSDADGVVDACDLDSDNDGILDSEEDLNNNGRFEDDDVDGDSLVVPVLGDGVSSYLDLDSDNDGILDLMEGRPFTRAQIDLYDANHDGVLDAGQSFGANGLLDALETSPDSGVLLPALATPRNTDGDDKPDFIDLTSNGTDFDLYQIGRSDLDLLGGGFISTISDADRDGIQAVVDTDLVQRGAPGSPYSPYSS